MPVVEPPVSRHRHVEASTVVQIDAISPEAAMRVVNGVGGAIKGRDRDTDTPLRVDTVYDEVRVRGSRSSSPEALRPRQACCNWSPPTPGSFGWVKLRATHVRHEASIVSGVSHARCCCSAARPQSPPNPPPRTTALPDLSWLPPDDTFDWIQLKSGEWLKGKHQGVPGTRTDLRQLGAGLPHLRLERHPPAANGRYRGNRDDRYPGPHRSLHDHAHRSPGHE